MYNFKIGDFVQTTDGRTGYITGFCKCEQCEKKGYIAPIIKYLEQEYLDCITLHDMYTGFRRFVRVGDYTLNNPVEKFKERETTESQEPKDSNFENFLRKWCAQKAAEKNKG